MAKCKICYPDIQEVYVCERCQTALAPLVRVIDEHLYDFIEHGMDKMKIIRAFLTGARNTVFKSEIIGKSYPARYRLVRLRAWENNDGN